MEPAYWEMRRIAQGIGTQDAVEEYLRGEHSGESGAQQLARRAGLLAQGSIFTGSDRNRKQRPALPERPTEGTRNRWVGASPSTAET